MKTLKKNVKFGIKCLFQKTETWMGKSCDKNGLQQCRHTGQVQIIQEEGELQKSWRGSLVETGWEPIGNESSEPFIVFAGTKNK